MLFMECLKKLRKKSHRPTCESETIDKLTGSVHELTDTANHALNEVRCFAESAREHTDSIENALVDLSAKFDAHNSKQTPMIVKLHPWVEVITMILTLLVAVLSYKTSVRSNEMAESAQIITNEQIALEQQEQINIDIQYNDAMTIIEGVRFSNSGGPISNFSIDVIPCFRVYYNGVEHADATDASYTDIDSSAIANVLIPIRNDPLPLLNVVNTKSAVDYLSSISLTPHITKCRELMESFSRGKFASTISLEYYICIEYENLSETHQNLYYHCRTGYYYDHEDAILKHYPIMHFSQISSHDIDRLLLDENGSIKNDHPLCIVWSDDSNHLDALYEHYRMIAEIQGAFSPDPETGTYIRD